MAGSAIFMVFFRGLTVVSILLIEDSWDLEIIRLIEQGQSDKNIAEQVPFRSDYVSNLRRKLKEFSRVEPKGSGPISAVACR